MRTHAHHAPYVLPAVAADTVYMRAVAADVIAEAGRSVGQPITEQQLHQRLLTAAQRTEPAKRNPELLPERVRTFIDGVCAGLTIGYYAGKTENF